jgi:CBS domain containing-hemolysin-like protein
MNELLIWIGILFCVTQSAMFSGLNLAFFSFTRLRLEIEAESSSSNAARKVLDMRKDSNFLLATILWGNVGINVLLTLLSDSVLAGIASFLFSTVIITLFGEIVPQAYFSRNSLKMASLLAPLLKVYQIILYPVAKPSGLLLDAWLGKELTEYFHEKTIKLFIKKHIQESDSEIDFIEGTGAINFLSLDDRLLKDEGELIDPDSIIALPQEKRKLVFPDFKNEPADGFIKQINKSGKKWIIFTNKKDEPVLVLDADGFIRTTLLCDESKTIIDFCHTPLVVSDKKTNMGEVLKKLRARIDDLNDKPIEKDIVLYWTPSQKKMITGADIFGRLLKGI